MSESTTTAAPPLSTELASLDRSIARLEQQAAEPLSEQHRDFRRRLQQSNGAMEMRGRCVDLLLAEAQRYPTLSPERTAVLQAAAEVATLSAWEEVAA